MVTTIVLPLATVTTAAPGAVSYTTATGGGNVTSDNGAPVTSRGICWATNPSPTTASSSYTEAGGTGAFTGSMAGLAASTTYYVRAFAEQIRRFATSCNSDGVFSHLPEPHARITSSTTS